MGIITIYICLNFIVNRQYDICAYEKLNSLS